MNEINLKVERARRSRAKFDQTWSEIAPKLTVYGLVDETVGRIMRKRRSDFLMSAVAVASAAWLINSVEASQNLLAFFKSKTAASKKEKDDHENPNTFRRNAQAQSNSSRESIGAWSKVKT